MLIQLKLKDGRCRLRIYNINNELVYDQTAKNRFLNQGKDIVGKYVFGIIGGAEIDRLGVGDGDDGVSFGDQALTGDNTEIKDISDRNYVRPNVVVGVEFLFAEGQFYVEGSRVVCGYGYYCKGFI